MGRYESSEAWQDIVPIPQDEGGPNPLAAIAYTDEYAEAMSYLRAVMAVDELSERVLALTEHVISMNPAHYTVWLYRTKALRTLKRDPLEELEWLNKLSLKHLKNYQIWHHRKVMMEQIGSLPSTETFFLSRMLAKDVKNYHVWSYRQWLIQHFSLWDSEYDFIESLIRADVRNNSAWNHRWFVTFGRSDGKSTRLPQVEVADEVYDREIRYAQDKIRLAPQNQSPWNYLRGILKLRGKGLVAQKSFASEFADLEQAENVQSSHALEFLVDVWSAEKQTDNATKALDLLAKKYDPIRKNYWAYRKSELDEVTRA